MGFLQWRLRKKNSEREFDSKNPIKRWPWSWLRVNFWFSHPILFLSPICRTLILYVYAWYAIILKHSDKLLSHNLRIFVKKKEKGSEGYLCIWVCSSHPSVYGIWRICREWLGVGDSIYLHASPSLIDEDDKHLWVGPLTCMHGEKIRGC